MRVQDTLAVLVAAGMSTPAAAQGMTPIDKFIEQNSSSTNGAVEVFVGLRCSSLFMLMSMYMANNKMNDEEKNFSDASKSAFNFAAISQNQDNKDYLVGQAKLMIEAYTERFLKSKALTGNFSDDPVIQADMKTCSDIF